MLIKKRSGELVNFNEEKIIKAVQKAFEQNELIFDISKKEDLLNYIKLNNKEEIYEVEKIQDTIIIWLHKNKFHNVGIYFAQYRERRNIARGTNVDAINTVNEYISKMDSMIVNENSSTMYSLQGLNNHIFSKISEKYWLSLYSDKIKHAHNTGRIHIHDAQVIGPYCCGWSLKDLLLEGFCGVKGKPQSAPPKHLSSALSQANNFIFTLQGESAGAQAFSNFNTLLAPFVKYDNLSYNQVKQEIQQFIFNLNISTRVGFQAPFSNITLDLDVTKTNFANEPIIIGGQLQNDIYSNYNKEATWINQAIVEVLNEGDKDGAMLSYPIVTFNVSKDFPWHNKLGQTILEASAKYGSFYFANYINSDYTDSDITSMCCRLRIDRKEISKHLTDYSGGLYESDYNETHQKGGGFFGAAPNTGSIGVVTLGLPAIMHDTIQDNGNWNDFLNNVKNYMDLAMISLTKKRKIIENYAKKGLYPYIKYYLKDVEKRTGHYFTQHFSTICPNGFHEALVVYGIKKGLLENDGFEKAKELLKFMNDYSVQLQKENKVLVNIEQSPAESAGVKLCVKSEIDPLCNGYYTNSTWFPANSNFDIYDQIIKQGSLNEYYTGGSSLHIYTDTDLLPIKNDIMKLITFAFTKTKLPYMTVSPIFSVCYKCGRISGKHKSCPICNSRKIEIYERIVGYYRAHKNWNDGRKKESDNRKYINFERK